MVTESYRNSENTKIGIYEGKEIDFEAALSIAGYGKYNIYLTIICGLCLFAVNTTVYGVGYVLPAAECDLNLSTTDKGLLTAVGFIGIVCSLYVWGAIADTKGRKKIILVSLMGSFVFTAATAFTTSFWVFATFQFLSGIAISGSSSTLYAYLGEFHTDKRRSTSIAWCTVFMTFALLILPGVAWLTISQTFSIPVFGLAFSPWRLFILLCAIPSLLTAFAMLALPESPKYLFVEGHISEALAILKKVYTSNTGKSSDKFPIQPFTKTPEYATKKENYSVCGILKTLWHQTVPLFQRQYLKYTSMTCILQFGTFAISSGLLLWYPDILNKLAENSKNNPNSSITVCEAITTQISQQNEVRNCSSLTVDYNVYQQNLIIGFAYLIGCSLVGFIIDLVGKRLLLVVNFLISAVCCVLLTLIASGVLVDILFIGVLVPPGLCVAVVNAAVVDIFPTHFKAMAVSLCLLMGRLGSVVASTIIGYLLDYSCNWTFYSYVILALGCTLLSLFVPSRSYSEHTETDDVP